MLGLKRNVKEQNKKSFIGEKILPTVTRWLQRYRSGGLSELLKIKKAPGVVFKKSLMQPIAGLEQEFKK